MLQAAEKGVPFIPLRGVIGSDILAHRFWDKAFRQLQDSGSVSKADSGKNAGCWVMPIEEDLDAPAPQAGKPGAATPAPAPVMNGMPCMRG